MDHQVIFCQELLELARAAELVLTNRTLSAQEALEWGLVNKVVDIKDLKNEVEELANKLALGPSLAFGKFKSLLHNSFLDSMEGQMEFRLFGEQYFEIHAFSCSWKFFA